MQLSQFKKKNLLSDRNKGKRIIREGNFVSGTFWCERSQVKKSGYFKGSSQFNRYWQISTLLKYSPFFGVKNLKSVLRIGGKMMEANHTFPRCQLLYKQT